LTEGGSPIITNSILWGNSADIGPELGFQWFAGLNPSTATVSYSDVEGGQAAVDIEPDCTLNWGPGNIDTSPNFTFWPLATATGLSYDADARRSTLSDTSASFTPGALVDLLLVPNMSDGTEFIVVSNTADSITVRGDMTEVASTTEPFDDYQIRDYHLQEGSPCIDTGIDGPVRNSTWDRMSFTSRPGSRRYLSSHRHWLLPVVWGTTRLRRVSRCGTLLMDCSRIR
jgi:hypothetical protein